jgi:hypothetical protein
MYATISGYRINWPMGENNILLVSVGTGSADSEIRRSELAAAHAFRSLVSLMDDVAGLQETLLQWMSASPRASKRDSELGTLEGDLLGGHPLLSYLRYDVNLGAAAVLDLLGADASSIPIENLTAMDAPENMRDLHRLGIAAGERDVLEGHFSNVFDLPSTHG